MSECVEGSELSSLHHGLNFSRVLISSSSSYKFTLHQVKKLSECVDVRSCEIKLCFKCSFNCRQIWLYSVQEQTFNSGLTCNGQHKILWSLRLVDCVSWAQEQYCRDPSHQSPHSAPPDWHKAKQWFALAHNNSKSFIFQYVLCHLYQKLCKKTMSIVSSGTDVLTCSLVKTPDLRFPKPYLWYSFSLSAGVSV